MRVLRTVLVLAAAMGCLMVAPSTSAATTFTVVNTNDSGPGSLRQAILDANANTGSDTIAFGILGIAPHTITPLSQLPAVTDPVTIDGTTQLGFTGCSNGMAIQLDGSAAGNADGLQIDSGPSTVRGLAINRFSTFFGAGIRLSGAGSHTVECNYLGTDPGGTLARPNFFGVVVASGDNTIGGDEPGYRAEPDLGQQLCGRHHHRGHLQHLIRRDHGAGQLRRHRRDGLPRDRQLRIRRAADRQRQPDRRNDQRRAQRDLRQLRARLRTAAFWASRSPATTTS